MENLTAIPALPCGSIQDTLNFYVALGFEITYQQTRPSGYGCVKYGDLELHFFTFKGYEPANSYSTCLIMVSDIDALYQTFAANLRKQYGKLPVAGIPRIGKPNNNNAAGDKRFNVVDPGGNWIRFIERNSVSEQPEERAPITSALGRSLRGAQLLVDSKGDFPAAAKMLDTAFERDQTDSASLDHLQALVLRLEIALNLNERELATQLITQARQISLTPDEQESATATFEKLTELEQSLEM